MVYKVSIIKVKIKYPTPRSDQGHYAKEMELSEVLYPKVIRILIY